MRLGFTLRSSQEVSTTGAPTSAESGATRSKRVGDAGFSMTSGFDQVFLLFRVPGYSNHL